MARNVLDLKDLLSEDQLACQISKTFMTWDMLRAEKKREWQEVRNYVYATDTRSTANAHLPWKNKTTTPKLTQIRDNLSANYMAAMFPKRKWMKWEGSSKEDEQKRKLIEDYAYWTTQQPIFKNEIAKLVYDFIDYGNCFVMVDWRDETVPGEVANKKGYVGPVPKRISPYDIVFDPTAQSFADSPKIIRSVVSLGMLKEIIERETKEASDGQIAQDLLDYFTNIRQEGTSFKGDLKEYDDFYRLDGFTSFKDYLGSNYIEILTFYGNIYDVHNKEFKKNRKIVIADRHKIIADIEEPSFFGVQPIFHVGWRPRQDNLWAMGPLDNLVGLQYRIDHLENLKADCFDLIAFPVLKIKGHVEDFEWGPFARIMTGDDGEVEVLAPDAQALNADMQIQILENRMEEMAGAPKEAMGFRTPGEKTMYEVQRLENAASRIFQSKIALFEEQIIEPYLNAALELAVRSGVSSTIRTIDPEFGATLWTTISKEDISGAGRIRPVAARHFAEKAQMLQNLNGLFSSPLGQNPAFLRNISGIQLGYMVEELLGMEEYGLFQPNVALAEEAEAAKLNNAMQEDVFVQSGIPGGMSPDDQPPAMEENPEEVIPSE